MCCWHWRSTRWVPWCWEWRWCRRWGWATPRGRRPAALCSGSASLGTLKWYITNALQFIVWSVFGDFLLLTPFASLFYRLMGAKLGLNVQINSKYCADLSLLEIGDGAVIGGHATIIAHAFESRGLILKKVRIGRQAIIGLNAILLPGVTVGERAVVGAGVFVPKDTMIATETTYLGT